MSPEGTPPPQGPPPELPSIPKDELREVVSELITDSGTRMIEFSVIGAAFVFVFLFCALLVWSVLRAAAREIRSAREETASANERSMQTSEKAIGSMTKVAERTKRTNDMLESVLTILHTSRGGRDVPSPDP